jgi:enediyne biosynthesis protein E4
MSIQRPPSDDLLDAAVKALRQVPIPEGPPADVLAKISAAGPGDGFMPAGELTLPPLARRWPRSLKRSPVAAGPDDGFTPAGTFTLPSPARRWRGLLRGAAAAVLLVLVPAIALGGFAWACLVLWPKLRHVVDDGVPAIDAAADPWTGPPIFQDVTAKSGIDFTFHNGEQADNYVILESLGGGAGLIDYDGDGLLDLFLIGGGYFDGPDRKTIKPHPCRLYKNLGKFKFRDVTAEAGLDRSLFFGHGAAVCDYDKDGWPDLLVTGYGRLALYRNVPGPSNSRKFMEVTRAAGLEGPHFWGTSAAWADFDGDGYPDLYVCQYVNWSWENNPSCGGYLARVKRDICPPKQFKAKQHRLYHNDGNGHFTEMAAKAGIRVDRSGAVKSIEERLHKLTGKLNDAQKREKQHLEDELESAKNEELGKGLGVVVVDVNLDGKPDIAVANDTVDRFLYLNHSRPGHLKFEEVGMSVGAAKDDQGVPQGSMGIDAGDPYGTGLPALWRNDLRNGHLSFQFNTAPAGIAAIGQLFVGFGTGFVDVDNDGWEDIFISNGHVIRHPHPAKLQQRPVMFLNQGHGKFKETRAGGSYFQTDHRGRGVAIGDLDNDGRPDLIISHVEEPVAILRNVAEAGNHWLGIKLAMKDRCVPVGARLVLDVDGRKLTRFAKGGGSYLSANDTRQLFGLGRATKAGRLTVEWPRGEPRLEHWDELAIDRYQTIMQGTGKPAKAAAAFRSSNAASASATAAPPASSTSSGSR